MLNFMVEETHASLPGHFPDHPMVAGVIILQHVLAAFKQTQPAECIQEICNVKFIRPLAINILADIIFSANKEKQFNFQVLQNDSVIVSGLLTTEQLS